MKILRLIYIFISCIFIFACHQSEQKFNGIVDADFTYISSNLAGTIEQMFVARGDNIKKGQALFILNSEPEKSNLAAALANLSRVNTELKKQESQLAYHEKLFKRYQQLYKVKGVSLEELDAQENIYNNDLSTVAMLKNDIKVREAEVAKARYSSGLKTLQAPFDAIVEETYYTEGEYVPEGRSIVSLLAPKNIKIIFYIPEIMLNEFPLHTKLFIACDGCKQNLPAQIVYISKQAEYTPPVFYSEKERTKMVYRVEAKLMDPKKLLHVGQPVTIISTRLE